MIIYGLKTCDSCRKARKSLPDARFHDVRAEGVPAATLSSAYAQFGGSLLNTRSTTWLDLKAEERESAPPTLITLYPALMKRPLIDTGEALYLGWTTETRAALGL